jgi:hypothetical protein
MIGPYPVLLGIDWDFNNMIVVDLKKRSMTFEGNGLKVIAPLDLMKAADTQNL